MHTLYCIIGRTGSGKSTITKQAANKLNARILKSYTTRARRKNEIGNDTDHTFINQSDVEKYRTDMVAYTGRIGYCSFATQQQLMESDFYIINPEGFYELQANTKDLDISKISIDSNNSTDEDSQTYFYDGIIPYNQLRIVLKEDF